MDRERFEQLVVKAIESYRRVSELMDNAMWCGDIRRAARSEEWKTKPVAPGLRGIPQTARQLLRHGMPTRNHFSKAINDGNLDDEIEIRYVNSPA
jgi:hypothetical protein